MNFLDIFITDKSIDEKNAMSTFSYCYAISKFHDFIKLYLIMYSRRQGEVYRTHVKNGVWGIGHWVWGIGYGAWGIGDWALGIGNPLRGWLKSSLSSQCKDSFN